jgi:hypothetical protein
MNHPKIRLVSFFACAVLLPCLLGAASTPDAPTGLNGYRAADPNAAPVTRQNLLASERFWPYRVTLTKSWKSPGQEKSLRKGDAGVLIRVESSGRAVIDFGRDGRHAVPVDETDLLEEANRIRRGEATKLAPNFALAIGPRLVDSSADPPHQLALDESMRRAVFLCVFADPDDANFASLANELAPLSGRNGVMTVLFPQGAHANLKVWERLRATKWMVPFVFDFLTKPYTDSVLGDELAVPAVVLQTNEGRLLLQSAWHPGLASELSAALDAAFGGSQSATGSAAR